MHAVEAVRAAQEICRRFAGAADAAQLCDFVRLNAVFVKRFDDLRCDRIVSATRTERRIGALIFVHWDSESVDIPRRGSRWLHRARHYFFSPFSAATTSSVT